MQQKQCIYSFFPQTSRWKQRQCFIMRLKLCVLVVEQLCHTRSKLIVNWISLCAYCFAFTILTYHLFHVWFSFQLLGVWWSKTRSSGKRGIKKINSSQYFSWILETRRPSSFGTLFKLFGGLKFVIVWRDTMLAKSNEGQFWGCVINIDVWTMFCNKLVLSLANYSWHYMRHILQVLLMWDETSNSMHTVCNFDSYKTSNCDSHAWRLLCTIDPKKLT